MHTIENQSNTLQTLLQTVQEQAQRAQDYLAPTNQLLFATGRDDNGDPSSQIIIEANHGDRTKALAVNSVCFDQIAQRANLDVRTARRLQSDYSSEYDRLINAIWQKESEIRMVRTFMSNENTGTARAFVSKSFKTFDNVNLLQSALPQLMDSPAQWKVVNGSVTDKRLYLRLKSEQITGTGAAVGDLMALGIGLSNSEVGSGSVSVYQMFWTLACLNGMQTGNKHRSSHVTSARDGDQWTLLTEEAKNADNHALELKVRDLVANFASSQAFNEVLDKMRTAASDILAPETGTQDAVARLGKVLTLTKTETASVLDGLLKTIGQSGYAGQPVSRATLLNAVTASAHNAAADDVDLWQQRGGRVLDLSPKDWHYVAAA
jgi:hypothetical protein